MKSSSTNTTQAVVRGVTLAVPCSLLHDPLWDSVPSRVLRLGIPKSLRLQLSASQKQHAFVRPVMQLYRCALCQCTDLRGPRELSAGQRPVTAAAAAMLVGGRLGRSGGSGLKCFPLYLCFSQGDLGTISSFQRIPGLALHFPAAVILRSNPSLVACMETHDLVLRASGGFVITPT